MRMIFLSLIAMLFASSVQAESGENSTSNAVPTTVAKTATPTAEKAKCVLLYATGPVEILTIDKKEWVAAKVYQELQPGDKIRTGQKGRAAVRLPSSTVLRVTESTTLMVPAQSLAKNQSLGK